MNRAILSLRTELGLSILVITHEIRVARRLSDTTAVMRAGRIVEAGRTAKVLTAPCSAYTRALVAAVLPAHPRQVSVQS
jgi:ABC-type dipeptide/oligopeptide/nickel transport system ATPase component